MDDGTWLETCPICYEAFSDKVILWSTPCNHNFCVSCITKFSQKQSCLSIPAILECPICRSPFVWGENPWENEPVDVLYQRLLDILNSEESRKLQLTPALNMAVKYILTAKNKVFLNYLLERTNEYEFQTVYKNVIINKYKYFDRIEDPYDSFALAWLFTKYH